MLRKGVTVKERRTRRPEDEGDEDEDEEEEFEDLVINLLSKTNQIFLGSYEIVFN